MPDIKYIFFDIGGVLILDTSKTNKWEELYQDMGIEADKFKQIWEKNAKRAGLDYDIDNLIPILEKELKQPLPEDYSLAQDLVNRFEFNPYIWPVVKKAQAKYQLGIITNQYPGLLNRIKKRGLLEPHNWHTVIDSSVVKMKKPDLKIYEYAQEQAGVKPEQILFIDNKQENLQPAKEMGWATFLYDPAEPKKSAEELLNYLGLA